MNCECHKQLANVASENKSANGKSYCPNCLQIVKWTTVTEKTCAQTIVIGMTVGSKPLLDS